MPHTTAQTLDAKPPTRLAQVKAERDAAQAEAGLWRSLARTAALGSNVFTATVDLGAESGTLEVSVLARKGAMGLAVITARWPGQAKSQVDLEPLDQWRAHYVRLAGELGGETNHALAELANAAWDAWTDYMRQGA